jgi:hypothetical protein
MTTRLIPILFLITGCADRGEIAPVGPQAPDDQLTWVARVFSGGVQCDPTSNYEPPEIRAMLLQVGVPVFANSVRHHLICEACHCPKYAATHFALILRIHVPIAATLGFEESTPP